MAAFFMSGVDRLARDFAGNFYKSALWVNARRQYVKSVGGLCERCYERGIIRHGDTVHHKIHLSPANINDPEVTLNPDNLILLCRDCHAELHKSQKRFKVDELGRITAQ